MRYVSEWHPERWLSNAKLQRFDSIISLLCDVGYDKTEDSEIYNALDIAEQEWRYLWKSLKPDLDADLQYQIDEIGANIYRLKKLNIRREI